MVKRQLPNPAELLELMQFKKPELNGKKRRLDSALTIYDLRTIAKRRTPKAAFDYTDGAAEGELSLSRARQAFEDIEFHPGDPAACAGCRHVRRDPGRPIGTALRHRAHRLHPPDADRGRGRRRIRSRGRRHPVHAVDPRNHDDRGRQGGEPLRAKLVPAVRHARSRHLLRAGPPRRRGGIRHAAVHGRHPGRRSAPARQAQRLRDPAAADRRNDRQRDPPPLVVVRLPHDAQARVRVAVDHRRHGGGDAQRRDGPDHQLRRPGGDPRPVARQDRGQGRAERRGLQAPDRRRRRRHHPLQPRWPSARPRADPVPPASRRSCARSARMRR